MGITIHESILVGFCFVLFLQKSLIEQEKENNRNREIK